MIRTLVAVQLLTWVAGAYAAPAKHDILIDTPVASGIFERLREPSGVAMLDVHTLIVVEDEASAPLTRLALSDTDPVGFAFEEFEQATSPSLIQRTLLAPLDDLEGVARLSEQQFFVIGSHENASRGKSPAREKLVLFTRDGNDIHSALLRQDLFDDLRSHYPALSDKVDGSKKGSKNALNIEGLAYDRRREHLLIGLRTPQLKNNAIIVTLTNAVAYLQGEPALFNDELKTIDLNKGGIRAMSYDDLTDTLLLVSKRESGGSNRSTLWTLGLDSDAQPVRFRSKDKNLFRNVEGLTPVGGGFLFVRDNGGRTKNAADTWFILAREQLALAQ